MAKCLLCNTELTDVKITIEQRTETHRVSKVPYGWMYLSPEETDPNLVEIFQVALPKDITGKATCKNCGADCELVGISDNEFITVRSETH